MKKRIIWFTIGFVVSWLAWSTIGQFRLRTRDYTQSWSDFEREIAPEWLKNAKGRRLGSIMVFTPPTGSPACALIHPPNPDHYPQVMIQDEDSDGTLDSLLIGDKLNQSFWIEDKDGDGIFDSSKFSTGIGTNSISISDNNMDGFPDFRFGPGRTMAVSIDNQWHDLIHTNKKQCIEISGVLTQVQSVDGIWKIIEKE
jgi:hypothetical protein